MVYVDKAARAPVGSVAPAIGGGWWFKTAKGWKWNGPEGNGGTFPRPGGDWNGKLYGPDECSWPNGPCHCGGAHTM